MTLKTFTEFVFIAGHMVHPWIQLGAEVSTELLKELKGKLKEIEANEMEYKFMKAGGDIKRKERAEFLHLLSTE